MLFNPDPSKPAQEVLFSKKTKVQNHPTISLNNIQVERASIKNNFKQRIDTAISKIDKGIAIIKKLDKACHVNH